MQKIMIQANHQHRRQSRIFIVPSSCSVFGGISWCSILAAPTQRNHHWGTFNNNWCNWAEHWSKNGQITRKTRQNDFPARQRSTFCCETDQKRKHSKRLIGMSLSHPPYFPELLFPITTYFDRWLIAYLSSASILMKISKNGSIHG